MSLLKRIFGFFWALWGAFCFLVIVIPLTFAYAFIIIIGGKKYSMDCVWFNCHVASPLILNLMLIKVKVFGKEKLDAKTTYVYVANHNSQIDIMACASAVPNPMRFLAKAETKYIPFFGYMVKMLGIVVDRQSKDSREKSYQQMTDALLMGESLFLYPEGTRNRTDEKLKEFKDGAFRVAIMAQVPVAVQTVIGAKEVNNPNGIQLYPGCVEIHWSEPIDTRGMTMADMPALRERVRAEMLKHLP
jgi:1-acyl-sn-glycerol-3-phosphate acyltransferase